MLVDTVVLEERLVDSFDTYVVGIEQAVWKNLEVANHSLLEGISECRKVL